MTTERRRQGPGLTVWHPFRDIERRFEDYFGSSLLPPWRRFLPEILGWTPALNVSEEEDRFVVTVELPGIKEDDVDITVSGDILTVSGEKKAESEVKKKGYYYSESSYGSFSRSITMPSAVDTNKIEASYDKGILEITLPKAPEVKSTKIKVSGKKKE